MVERQRSDANPVQTATRERLSSLTKNGKRID
jgi:hypothetical protein